MRTTLVYCIVCEWTSQAACLHVTQLDHVKCGFSCRRIFCSIDPWLSEFGSPRGNIQLFCQTNLRPALLSVGCEHELHIRYNCSGSYEETERVSSSNCQKRFQTGWSGMKIQFLQILRLPRMSVDTEGKVSEQRKPNVKHHEHDC